MDRTPLLLVITVKYVLTLLGFVLISAAVVFWAYIRSKQFIWYGNENAYILGKFLEKYATILAPLYVFSGWTVITYFYFRKTLRLISEVTFATRQLASGNDDLIVLSKSVKYVEDELNLVRERSLRNAAFAKEAEQRKNDLIVYLAHDLKTPLTSVIGYLTLLRDEQDISKELRLKYQGIALDKALRLEELITEFFDITRFSLSNMTLRLEHLNLTRLIEQITFEYQPALDEKNLQWQLELESEVQWHCDAEKIKRVLDNLIRNAIHYSYSNTTIHVKLLYVNDQFLSISIENKGQTIPPEKINYLFDQFFRLDASRASHSGGAGLGLAIVKEIVELHGGTIQASSSNESILFSLEFPLKSHKFV